MVENNCTMPVLRRGTGWLKMLTLVLLPSAGISTGALGFSCRLKLLKFIHPICTNLEVLPDKMIKAPMKSLLRIVGTLELVDTSLRTLGTRDRGSRR